MRDGKIEKNYSTKNSKCAKDDKLNNSSVLVQT